MSFNIPDRAADDARSGTHTDRPGVLRVLVCGSRRWPWPESVEAVLDRLAARHGDQLVVIEGAATGADAAAHKWCLSKGLGPDRHRCHPVDWAAERRARPKDWRLAGPAPGMPRPSRGEFGRGGGPRPARSYRRDPKRGPRPGGFGDPARSTMHLFRPQG
ncbi:SLOG family protein [Streptomyces sp. NPDC057580]|uniref:SLOG family protein n=1 Tax=Streptomyces sp. NPDC057580 TaxID=3346173 RepID=UPI00368E22B1